ncbi:TetR/AcrR family transcriptional regulator [Pseudoroseomonas cervicalis]|uniref:TetR/AcrR family transcriptional regulator n=1 Tax=Teichococcus cervicalis TaxID=204525 RepID=UPI0027865B7C|nr:TetR/AcrR family transcriptional regulator [Pseudoroseomonas cervicalis]MDQ1080646.1 AcrR family transcriptional regulator [Pseudoroseomonas cervicalis]
MGRPPSIDRDKVLDLAEAILLKDGTAALTLDAVARAAGVSKGGIQSRFGTKDELLAALVERWSGEYDSEMQARLAPDAAPAARVRAHLDITMGLQPAEYGRAAGFMATLIESVQRREEWRRWYAEHFGALDPARPEGQRARLALLAVEGAFILRAFGLMGFGDAEWETLRQDLHALLEGRLGTGEEPG